MELIEGSELKRFFRARMKLNYAGNISHLTQRAAGADLLFHEDDDYLEFLGRMKEVAENYTLEILSFVCMPNHVHIQVRQSENNLPDAMRELFSRFARRQNSKYQRKGHLFGGPYRQAVCFDPLYALSVSLYIHLNPVRAGLTKDPRNYRFFMKTKQSEEIVPEHNFIDLMHALVEKRPVQLPKDREACKYLVEQLLSRGYTRSDIAKRLSISRKTVYNLMKSPLPISGHTGFG